jgi:HTH-type transcriptional regulator / antitoxin HipB
MRYTPALIGEVVRRARTNLGVTQADLALTAGTGLRFIVDLESGKPTCELGKVLTVINTLGVEMTLTPPIVDGSRNGPAKTRGHELE